MPKLLFGVASIGEGSFKSYETVNGKQRVTRLYRCWHHMLDRCYGDDLKWNATYAGCTVSKRWHDFQNFAADITKMHGSDIDGWQLDKDIIEPGNKLYSRRTCCFVPPAINMLFRSADKANGNRKVNTTLPEGVYITPKAKYVARLAITGRRPHLGTFETIAEARRCYLTARRKYLRELANEYKASLAPKTYQALRR